MNWNTSSSFENLAPPQLMMTSRSRTPSNRRSAVADKREDDVVFRICRFDLIIEDITACLTAASVKVKIPTKMPMLMSQNWGNM